MKELLKRLKVGTSKEYPIYGSYIHSDGVTLQTCNKNELVHLDYEAPFIGDIKFSVLENIYSSAEKEEVLFNQLDELTLEVRVGKTKFTINVDDIGFPEITHNPIEPYLLTEEMVGILNIAIRFVGKGLYSYIYVDEDCVCATNMSQVFLAELDTGFKTPIGINADILRMIIPNAEIGIDQAASGNNVILEFDDGFMSFIVDDISAYPIDKIKDIMKKVRTNIVRVCDSEDLGFAAKKVSPILVGELQPLLRLSNEDEVLSVIAESKENGRAVANIESESGEDFQMKIRHDFVKILDKGFNVSVYNLYEDKVDRLYLSDGLIEIILMGYAI